MNKSRIVLAVCTIVLAIVLISGCTTNTSTTQQPCANCTVVSVVSTPLSNAVDLHKKGFDAYINQDYAKALDYYNQSLVADPKYTRAWIDKGNVLMSMNRTAEAVSAYDAALTLENDIAAVWNKRGVALMATGNYTAARDSFDRALQLAPDYIEAKENRNLTLAKLK